MQLQNERSFLANLRMLSDWSVDCNKIYDAGTVQGVPKKAEC